MKRLTILLAGVSLSASHVAAGSVSNIQGTLDTTLVDPGPASYPHFICASGCNGGSNTGAMSQSGAWTVGVSNFPATQAVNGSVSVPGVATSSNQPALSVDGGGLAHITNFPSIQSINGTVTVGNLPATQTVSGSINVANFPATQAVNGSVSVPGVATSSNQPALSVDGGGLAHITNFPSIQSINGTVTVGNLPATQTVSGSINVANFPTTQAVSVAGVSGATPFPVYFPTSPGVNILGSTSNATYIGTTTTNPAVINFGYGWSPINNRWDQIILDSSDRIYTNIGAIYNAVDNGLVDHTANGALATNQPPLTAAGVSAASAAAVQGVSGGVPFPVTLSDGADTSLGSKADLATGVGNASVIALLKQLHLDSAGSIPAGSNVIGAMNLGAQTVFNTPITSTAAESSHVFKAAAGQLTSAYAVSSVSGYLMILNSVSAPPDGAVFPIECVPVPANVGTGISFSGLPPESYSTGITAVFSATGCFTKTASATAFFHGAVQ